MRFSSQWDLVPPYCHEQPSLTGEIRSPCQFSYSNAIRLPSPPEFYQHGERAQQPDQSKRSTDRRPHQGYEQYQHTAPQMRSALNYTLNKN